MKQLLSAETIDGLRHTLTRQHGFDGAPSGGRIEQGDSDHHLAILFVQAVIDLVEQVTGHVICQLKGISEPLRIITLANSDNHQLQQLRIAARTMVNTIE